MSHQAPISVLMVEDNPGDARLVQEMLRSDDAAMFTLTHVDTMQRGLERLAQQTFQVILLDLSLPDSQGLGTVAKVQAAAPAVPIVVLTGNADDDVALNAVKAGAQDYLVKGQGDGDLIRRSIRYAIERRRADDELRRSEERFRAVFENAGIGIVMIGLDGRYLQANPAFCRMVGFSEDELKQVDVAQVTHPDDRDATDELSRSLLRGERDGYRADKRYLCKTGEIVWGRLTATLVRGMSGEPVSALGLIEDVSERKHMEDRLRLSATVLEATNEGIFVTDADQRIIHVNPAFTALTGFTSDDVLGHTPRVLSSGRHTAEFYEKVWQTLERLGSWQGEIWNRRKSGELFAEWLNISVIRDQTGDITNYVAIFTDITSRKQTEERLNYQANHDPLTSLPNRALFHERLSRALSRAQRNQLQVGLLFLDLDHFKEVNDTYGHLIGDLLLQAVAERLTDSMRQGDTVARLAGDEFTIVLEDIDDYRDAAIVSEKVLQRLAEPFVLNGHRLSVTTSIGISLYPSDGEDTESLLKAADVAMYRAKKQGKNNYQFFADHLNVQAFERLALESSLRHALQRNELRLYYQPIYDMASRAIVAAEALIRWQHPEVGMVAPAQLLPLAEETGLILPIGRWVIGTACAQAMRWHEDGFPDLRITVNMSPHQLRQLDVAEAVAAVLRETKLPAHLLELELPESTIAQHADDQTLLKKLKATGVRISVDDFGTGYSSFGYLRRLPIDSLKIDQAFVRDIMTDADDAKIITAITAIAHSLRLTVIAEGVETEEQCAFLRRHHCDQAQGFFFSKPLTAEEFGILLKERRSLTA